MLEDRGCINELAGLGRAFELQEDCEILTLLGFWARRELFSVVADAVVAAVVVTHSRDDRGEDGTDEDIDARGEVVDVCCAEVLWGEGVGSEEENSESIKLGRVASVEALVSVSNVSSLVKLLDSS